MSADEVADIALHIRAAERSDAEALAPLLVALGYPTPTQELRPRLERLSAASDAGVLVAEAGDEVVGFASFHVLHLIYRPLPQARLTALAVLASHRRHGVGHALVQAVEGEARRRGCSRIELTTRVERPSAHAFYRALGYEERSLRFVKALGDVP